MPVTKKQRTGKTRKFSSRVRLKHYCFVLGASLIVTTFIVVILPTFHHAVDEIKLPLRHEDIIRQQAQAKNLDPALIAALIYVESRFRQQTSSAGATGLMQILPATAKFIAHQSGGIKFEKSDLGNPQINIAYGSYYLRYLLDRYHGNEQLALAAYNAGESNVDRWVAQAHREGRNFSLEDIPYPETRGHVNRVLRLRRDYRKHYSAELGLR